MIFYDYFSVFFFNFGAFFNTFLLWKIFLTICLCYYLLRRRGNNHFAIHFRLIRPVNFPSKDGKDAVCEGRNGVQLFISRQSRHISFVIIMNKVLFPTLYLYLACKQLCFPPRKRYK